MNSIKNKRSIFLFIGKIIISILQYCTIVFNGLDIINIISFIILHAIFYYAVNSHFENDLFIEENYLKDIY